MLATAAALPNPLPAALSASRRAPWSGAALGLIVAVLLCMAAATANWPNLKITRWDAFGYYLYLPATTVYHDLGGLQFVPALLDRTDLTNRGNPAHPLGNWEVSRVRTGPDRYVIKYTMGQAVLWWPFFQAAHFYARHFGPYPADGYSPPYQLAMYLAGLAYALLGLGLLRRLLLHCFSDRLSAAVLLTIYFGTNYLVYSVFRSLYSHNALFVLHTATLLLLVNWLPRPRWYLALGLGLTTGLAVLIRPSEIIILLAPLLLGVASAAGLRARGRLAGRHLGQVALAGALAVALNVPQLLYWHRMSGRWVYDSYPNEQFNFRHPHLFDGLFSFNNGWLIYTPVMGLAVVGVGLLWRQRREWFWLLATYLSLHIFISYSWWCWWYADSFGSRAMMQAYPLLALPLGVVLRYLWRRSRWVRGATVAAVGFCMMLNAFQAWQMRQGIFVTEYMTRRYYGAIFGKTQLTKDDLAKFDANEPTPDAGRYQPEQVYLNAFEAAANPGAALSTAVGPHPPVAFVDAAHVFSPGYQALLGPARLRPGDWVQARVQAFYPQKEFDTNRMPQLVVEYRHPNAEPYRWQAVRITNKVGPTTTLWGGTPGVWDDVEFACHVPREARPDDQVRVYVTINSSQVPLYLDNLRVTLLRKKP